MIERVYWIGAGASVPYGLPTLKTLTWELSQSLSAADRETLLRAVYECFGVILRKPEDSPDFEEFLNRLDPRALFYLEDTGLGGANSEPRFLAVRMSFLTAASERSSSGLSGGVSGPSFSGTFSFCRVILVPPRDDRCLFKIRVSPSGSPTGQGAPQPALSPRRIAILLLNR